MKNKSKIIASLLSVTTILSVTGCNSANSEGSTESKENTTASQTSFSEEFENSVNVSKISLDIQDPEDIEPATLNYLGCYDLRAAGDIKPAYLYFQENYGCSIEVTMVGSLQIQEKLTLAVQSDESPDLVDYAENIFPLLISSNLYTPLDEYIDLTAPQWNGLEKYIDMYKWNGKRYYVPWMYYISPRHLIYNRGLFEDLGIDDPKELYDKGEWTWDTFKKCMGDFVASEEGRTGFYGQISTAFFDTTGVPLISIGEDGKLTHNFTNSSIERAANFLQEIKNLGWTKKVDDYIDISEEPIIGGYSAFQSMGEWIITNYAKKMIKTDKYPDLDVFFVPYPRDPNADEYYLGMNTFGYLVPAGSKYAKQACVFINCCRLSVTDKDLAETTKASIMKNKKYTDEMYDFFYSFHEPENFNAIIDEPFGLDETTSQLIQDMVLFVALPFNNPEDEKTWTQMREANVPAIDKQISYFNGLMS